MAEINTMNSSSTFFLYITPAAGGTTIEVPYSLSENPAVEESIDEIVSELAHSSIAGAELTTASLALSSTAPISTGEEEMDLDGALLPPLATGEPRPLPPLPPSGESPMDAEVDDLDALWDATKQLLQPSADCIATIPSMPPIAAAICSFNNADDIDLLWHMLKIQSSLTLINNQK